jgi:hypothetical protein
MTIIAHCFPIISGSLLLEHPIGTADDGDARAVGHQGVEVDIGSAPDTQDGTRALVEASDHNRPRPAPRPLRSD